MTSESETVGDDSEGGKSGRPPGPALACLGVNLALLAAVVAMVVLSRAPLWFDEAWYLGSVEPLRQSGLTVRFLREMPGPAGPLYAVVHALFEPITRLRPVEVRLLNVGLFVMTLGALGWVMRRRGVERPWMVAAGLVAAPVMFGVVGTALTEIPAMLFFCLQVALLVEAFGLGERNRVAAASGLAVLAGLCLGLAFAGRQQYALALVAAPVLGLGPRGFRPALAAYLASAVVIPACLIAVWQGITPPSTASVGSGISIPHLCLSFAYAGLVYCLYDTGPLRTNLGVIAVVTVANLVFGFVAHLPLRELAKGYIPVALQVPLGRLSSGLMMGFGVLFMVYLARIVLDRKARGDLILWYLALASVFMLTAPAKTTHQFAGRYIIQALPLLVVIASERSPDTYWKAVRLAVGGLVGLLSLSAYLKLTL